jgi:hypothetical protein
VTGGGAVCLTDVAVGVWFVVVQPAGGAVGADVTMEVPTAGTIGSLRGKITNE